MARTAIIAALATALLIAPNAGAATLAPEAQREALTRATAAGSVTSVQASQTTLGGARGAVEPPEPTTALAGTAAPLQTEVALQAKAAEPVEMVVAAGTFTLTAAHRPKGAPAPKGKFLTMGVDPASHHVVYLQLGNKRPVLPGVKLATSTATIARRARARAATSYPCVWEHCYSLDRWSMVGSAGEKIVGSDTWHVSETMAVPEYMFGYFADEEEWVSFPELGWFWIEVGQTAGEYYDCCGLHWFFAWRRKGDGYGQYVAPWADRYRYGNYNYALYTQGNGGWCARVDTTTVGCTTGLLTYSKEVEVGVEIYSAKPVFNVTRDESNAWWTNWTAHNWNRDQFIVDPVLCAKRNPWSPYPGNQWSTTC